MFVRKSVKALFCLVSIVLLLVSVSSAFADDYNYKVIDGIDLANLRDAQRGGRVIDQIPSGTPIYVVEYGKYMSKIEYEGCVLYVYSELIEPLEEGATVPMPQKQPEKTYTLEGTTPYRVVLNMSTWVNIRRQKLDNGGSSGELYRGDIVFVKKIDSEGWATIIWNSKARYVRAKFLEEVTEDMDPLETPPGEYTITIPKKNGTNTVYIRKEPSVKADIRMKLKQGTIVVVEDDYGAWAKVSDVEGKELGFIMTYYLTPADDAN